MQLFKSSFVLFFIFFIGSGCGGDAAGHYTSDARTAHGDGGMSPCHDIDDRNDDDDLWIGNTCIYPDAAVSDATAGEPDAVVVVMIPDAGNVPVYDAGTQNNADASVVVVYPDARVQSPPDANVVMVVPDARVVVYDAGVHHHADARMPPDAPIQESPDAAVLPPDAAVVVIYPDAGTPSECDTDEDCPEGEACVNGHCVCDSEKPDAGVPDAGLGAVDAGQPNEPDAGTVDVMDAGQPNEPDAGYSCKEGKTLVCHYPPGNPPNYHNICVGTPSVPAHLAHGDTLGACPPR